MAKARYDGVAEWFDRKCATTDLAVAARKLVVQLLGRGTGRLLDVGCGGGAHAAALSGLGWSVTGIDVSADQLRLARARGVDVVQGRAERLPFADESFDAAVSMWTHTDVDDFPAALHELARVLRPGSPFVYQGAHPCFVGPHSRFVAAEGVPELHRGYWRTAYHTDAPGISPNGLRAKVGASHLPLGRLLDSFLDAGFALERVAETPESREYPYVLTMRWRR